MEKRRVAEWEEPLRKIEAGDPESRSADVAADNLERLKALFPEAFADGRIDFEVLKQLLGGAVDDSKERYGLNWHGKRRALWTALMPSTGTLRPCPQESVDWETTRNVVIEGDNLEVLKLLQKSYAGKVKLIYIDPPYNTGNDFVYPDDWRDGVGNYLALTGQADGERRKLSSNPETSGRFHTDWLNMMYPRLKLARSLLCKDGVIFISINDVEFPTLRFILNDIFGEENFLASFVWKSRQNKDNRTVNGASIDHEYVVCYGNKIKGDVRDRSQYTNPDEDPRGDWASANMVGIATADRRPNLHYDLMDPETGIDYGCPDMGWRYDSNTMKKLISEDRIIWPSKPQGRPRRKVFLSELESQNTGFSSILGSGIHTRDGTRDMDTLFSARIFNFPKPARLIATLVEQGSQGDDIVFDFFAGSGTTGHAVMEQNAADGGRRRYVLVQLPEPLDPANREQKTAADFCDRLGKPRNIAELAKERLRRAAGKVRDDHPAFAGDLGFRVFKLDSSNIRAWDPDPDDLEGSLLAIVNRVKEDRSDDDIFHEILLKFGYDLSTPVETRTVAGKCVRSVGGGLLIVCLEEALGHNSWETLAEGIAQWHVDMGAQREATAVFRDNAFGNDVVKLNVVAILEQSGLTRVYSL